MRSSSFLFFISFVLLLWVVASYNIGTYIMGRSDGSYDQGDTVEIREKTLNESIVTLQVKDPDGNVIYVKTQTTEDNITTFRFKLADDAEEGTYSYYMSTASKYTSHYEVTNGEFKVEGFPIIWIIPAVLASIFMMVWFNDRGRYLLLGAFVTPLYTRVINKDIERDVIQQNNRGRIYQHIKENPGTSMSEIRNAVETGNGTTVYHLQKLQGDQIIVRKGKQYYLRSARPQIFGRMKRPLKRSEENIVEFLRKQGMSNETVMSQQFSREQSTVNRDLKPLMGSGVVTREKVNGAFSYSLTPTFVSWFDALAQERQQHVIDEAKFVEPIICPACGKEITLKGATFCPYCSRSLKET